MGLGSLLCSSPSPQILVSGGGLHPPNCRADFPPSFITVTTAPLNYGSKLPSPAFTTIRFKNVASSRARQRLVGLFASNFNPSGGDSIKDKSDEVTRSDAAKGPPFLTILAGFLVFLLVCWVFGSIIMWLFGLIVNVPPSKKV